MAISLGGHRRFGEQQAESKRIAAQYASQQRKAKKRGFFSNILGGVGGKLLSGALGGALGIASGGLLMPLITAGSNILAKKAAHGLTKGMAADPSQRKATGPYGYGKEEAKTLREGLEEQISASQGIDFGKELLSSYVMAGASGGLKNVGKAIKGGEGASKGLLMGTSIGGGGKEIIGTGLSGWEGAKAGLGDVIGDVTAFGGEKEDVATDVATDFIPTVEDPTLGPAQEGEWEGVPFLEEGGLVPEYNIGGSVQPQIPTIANYFGKQGVSLGGSFKHSFAEMLGKR